MKPNKACPIVLRQNSDAFELMAFQHPLAGCRYRPHWVTTGMMYFAQRSLSLKNHIEKYHEA